MSDHDFSLKITRTIRQWNGSKLVWDIQKYQPLVHAIRAEQSQYAALSPDAMKAKAQNFGAQIKAGVDPTSLLAPVFGLVVEAIRKTLGFSAFDEQLICGIVLHQGKLAQMQTGEGKTLAAVFPAVLNGLGGGGVHILTFNDYLARRDADWMGPAYRLLGLSIGFVREGMGIKERQSAYAQDITYLTAKEAGFDFLRDTSRFSLSHIVQRPLHYAIVDEADSILIDEARIPMVIAEKSGQTINDLAVFGSLAKKMQRELHFIFDSYGRKISLTDQGIDFAEKELKCGNLFSEDGNNALPCLYHALHAEHLLHKNVDYLARSNQIELIDELTGRVAENRRWPEGLHSAVEAKEGIAHMPRGVVRGSVTMHHFIANYPKLSAMTATAEAAEEEFFEWYGLATVIIPPHSICIRKDFPDQIYRTKKEKLNALIQEIAGIHATGRPILVGTRTVRDSRELTEALALLHLKCSILNAEDNAQEASIIAQAGAKGAITISTNMAGRGTDIKLGGSDGKSREQVAALGGLYVIGVNRFQSRRIDDQLRGRAGRQGDPGSSRFFISLEDDLFVKYKIADLIPKRFTTSDEQGLIQNAYANNEVNRLQRIIEGQNANIKRTLGKYSVLLEQQRELIADHRGSVLQAAKIPEELIAEYSGLIEKIISTYGDQKAGLLSRSILLSAIDHAWSSYLADMADVREGIHFRRFGMQNPIHIFNTLAIQRFKEVLTEARDGAIERLSQTLTEKKDITLPSIDDAPAPSATWTYLISDDPFEDNPELQMSGNINSSIAAAFMWPITLLILLLRRMRDRKKRNT